MKGKEAGVKGVSQSWEEKGNGGSRCDVIVKECLRHREGWKTKDILQIRYILAKMRALEGKKQESDESQDEKRHREELQQHCGKKTPHV